MQRNTDLHIGEIICRKIKEQGRTQEWLAKQISCTSSSLSRILGNKSINTEQLMNISVAMECNFFEEYTALYNKKLKNCNICNNCCDICN